MQRSQPSDHDLTAAALRPVLGFILSAVFHGEANQAANQERLQKILGFWASKEVYPPDVMSSLEDEMRAPPVLPPPPPPQHMPPVPAQPPYYDPSHGGWLARVWTSEDWRWKPVLLMRLKRRPVVTLDGLREWGPRPHADELYPCAADVAVSLFSEAHHALRERLCKQRSLFVRTSDGLPHCLQCQVTHGLLRPSTPPWATSPTLLPHAPPCTSNHPEATPRLPPPTLPMHPPCPPTPLTPTLPLTLPIRSTALRPSPPCRPPLPPPRRQPPPRTTASQASISPPHP